MGLEKLPFISAKCITYGRVHLLEESIESFIKQDYAGKKELVIVNDYPLQKLIYNHPDVRIINLDKTFDTIGEKENFAVSQCKSDIIAVWDDDDVAMPNHLSNIAKYFVEGSDLLHWHRGVFFNEPSISAITGLGNSGIVYSKQVWERVGGHPIENAGYDNTFVYSIRLLPDPKLVFAEPEDEDVSWFYMWGGRGYHMSGQGTDTPDKPNVIQRHSEHVELERQAGRIPTGDVQLNPNWKYDYKQMLKDHVSRIHNSNI
jgi:glycosyltransferase involved in cell wall biosynthesis